VISAALALMCAGLALAWSHEYALALTYRGIADCFRSIAEEDRVPQDKECVGR
jgi:hypothetical protein